MTHRIRDRPMRLRGDGRQVQGWLPWFGLAVTLSLSFLWKSRCLPEIAWWEGTQYRLFCYSDIIALWHSRGFSEGLVPYLQEGLEYPPLIGLQVGVTAAAARWVGGGVGWFFFFNALVHVAAAAWILHLLRRHVSGRAIWWAVAPPLFLYAFHNWDLPALSLLVWAISLHRDDRDALSGLATGLGAAAKLVPVLVLPVLVVARLWERRPRDAARMTVAAVVTWAAVNVPVALAAPDAWSRFFEFSREREVTAGTVWAVLHRWEVLDAQVGTVNLLSAVSLATGFGVLLLVGTTRLRPTSLWAVTLPVVAWFLLTNKVFSPQFDLWMVPLLVLAGRPWMAGWFFVVDPLVFLGELSFLGGRASFSPMAAAVVARTAVLIWIVVGSLPRETSGGSAPGVEPHPRVGGRGRKRNAVPDGSEVDEGSQRQP